MQACANPDCDQVFIKNTHNQKYCSAECCKIITRIRIKEIYRDNKDRRSGKARICKRCKTTKLSRYNASPLCQSCKVFDQEIERLELLSLIEAI